MAWPDKMKLFRCKNKNRSQFWVIAKTSQDAKEYLFSMGHAKKIENIITEDFTTTGKISTRNGLKNALQRSDTCLAGIYFSGPNPEDGVWKTFE